MGVVFREKTQLVRETVNMKWQYEEEGRGGEDPQEVPRQGPRHCREITQSSYWRFGQEKVPGTLRSHCWPVLLPHQEEDQSPPRGRSVLLCQQRDPPDLRHHGVVVSGTP